MSSHGILEEIEVLQNKVDILVDANQRIDFLENVIESGGEIVQNLLDGQVVSVSQTDEFLGNVKKIEYRRKA